MLETRLCRRPAKAQSVLGRPRLPAKANGSLWLGDRSLSRDLLYLYCTIVLYSGKSLSSFELLFTSAQRRKSPVSRLYDSQCTSTNSRLRGRSLHLRLRARTEGRRANYRQTQCAQRDRTGAFGHMDAHASQSRSTRLAVLRRVTTKPEGNVEIGSGTGWRPRQSRMTGGSRYR